ncbi:MAG: hypothetical protein UT24_C0027G0007 [Candidatus Woesebacteria bacterium GW2011_GWB1_39_12]|uniref:Uncharacterized protein n=1 Tax=Candidatus Woesebacteria bacterium GW2011_GWB1_39_12 TaxID=1618574 RepID=A0A0G0MFQ2_9BACT|nr:MAG: hypothetical protein UT24_C0027G0007 [Candidatus Woesebacteria bacterium GW2011_GWB1_39_12]
MAKESRSWTFHKVTIELLANKLKSKRTAPELPTDRENDNQKENEMILDPEIAKEMLDDTLATMHLESVPENVTDLAATHSIDQRKRLGELMRAQFLSDLLTPEQIETYRQFFVRTLPETDEERLNEWNDSRAMLENFKRTLVAENTLNSFEIPENEREKFDRIVADLDEFESIVDTFVKHTIQPRIEKLKGE